MTSLSPQQADIVDFVLNDSRSLVVVARAGCGKTYTLRQIVKAIRTKHPTTELFMGAFNKAIAAEIEQLVRTDFSAAGLDYNWKTTSISTMHSAGFNAWRKTNPGVHVDDKKVKNIIERATPPSPNGDPHPWTSLAAVVAKAVSLAKGSGFGFLHPYTDDSRWYSLLGQHGLDEEINECAGGIAYDEVIEFCTFVFKKSLDTCREMVDFDDMLLAPLVFNTRIWLKDFVLIDEAQDLNPVRRALALKMLKPKTGRLIAVGDDRQALYAFTGADCDSLELTRAAVNAQVLPLNVTYRCPKLVVERAQTYVPDFTVHPSAPEGQVLQVQLNDLLYKDRKGNALHHTDFSASDAVLCRNTKPLVEFAYQLIRLGTACRVEGRDIGIGLIQLAQRWKVKDLNALVDKLTEYRDKEVQKWLAKGKEDRAAGVEDKVETVLTLVEACLFQDKTTVADLVGLINLMFGDTKPGDKPNCLTLSTVHKAKGREWDRVFLLQMSQYCPSKFVRKPEQLKQEQNILYVADTRAKQTLVDIV